MYVLRIEHAVPDFDGWKRAFDGDPMGREKAGVRRHRIVRSVEEPNFVMIDLEFETAAQAETMMARLHQLWGRVQVMRDPRARIVEVVENREYTP
jgi:hypothetical protein